MAVQKGHTETAEAIASHSRGQRPKQEHQEEEEHIPRPYGDDGIESREPSERLFRAVVHSDEIQVRGLISLGADIDTRYENGWTLLHYAANGPHSLVDSRMILTLFELVADPNARDGMNQTPLHLAALTGNEEIIPTLTASGAKIDARDDRNETALHRAAAGLRPREAVSALIAAGADVDAKNARGDTPLHRAVHSPRAAEAVSAMIAASADVDARNVSGDTPLHLAALKGMTEVASQIIEAGADVNARVTEAATPLSFAIQEGHAETAAVIQSSGGGH